MPPSYITIGDGCRYGSCRRVDWESDRWVGSAIIISLVKGDYIMRTIDLSPLHRFAVGFDRMQRQFDHLQRLDDTANTYPPYNIEAIDEDSYRVTLAVAGFTERDLDVTIKENTLYVTGKLDHTEEQKKYLHQGIAGRTFERRFELADHIKVLGANLENGLLHVDLVREIPEEMKPRTIKISNQTVAKKLESKAA